MPPLLHYRFVTSLDARFRELVRLEPQVVPWLFDLPVADARTLILPDRRPDSNRELDAIVRYVGDAVGSLLLHIEFQTRPDALMGSRMVVYRTMLQRLRGDAQIRQQVMRVQRTTAMRDWVTFPEG